MLDVGYGDGSTAKRKDGRLQVRVMIAGKREYRYIPKRIVDADPKAARKMAADLKRRLGDQREAAVSPSSQTLADFLQWWIGSLRDAKRKRVRARTLDGYAMIVEEHIIPRLGKLRLERLTERDVQAWIDRQTAAPRTIDHRRAVLRRALNVAYRQRMIERNPAIAIEMPEADTFRGSPLTVEEAARLFSRNVDDPLLPLWRLAIDSGLRQSELLGLGWDNLDLQAGTVTVGSQLQRRRGQWIRTPTKAQRSVETISLDIDTVTALTLHKVRQAAARTPGWRYPGLVFTTGGEPWFSWTVLRLFHEALDRAGIARRRFHDLRGSSATLMKELGVAEDIRMARQGHNTTAMARRYAQSRPGFDRAAASALGDAIRKASA